jgi:RNA polymerase sigma-70 factor (ECF subfamily)
MRSNRTNPSAEPAHATRTRDLLSRVRAGDDTALGNLMTRFLPQLQRWAHRRVPGWARNAADTGDFIQETLLHTLRNLGSFESAEDGALLRYLRRSLMNRIRDQFRHSGRHPRTALDDIDVTDPAASPLDFAIDRQNRQRYLAALARLNTTDRIAIIGRIELGYTYDQLALILRKPTPGAARLAIRRALARLADAMRRV